MVENVEDFSAEFNPKSFGDGRHGRDLNQGHICGVESWADDRVSAQIAEPRKVAAWRGNIRGESEALPPQVVSLVFQIDGIPGAAVCRDAIWEGKLVVIAETEWIACDERGKWKAGSGP